MGGNKAYIGLSTDMSWCIPGTNPKLPDPELPDEEPWEKDGDR